jgi:predicted RNA binding protein YcfA (HicA-like mRNA interferase family)
MGGPKTELKKALKTYGWVLERHGTRHDLYRKAGELLSIPTGTKMYSRAVMNIMQQIKGKSKRSNFRIENELQCTQDQPNVLQDRE